MISPVLQDWPREYAPGGRRQNARPSDLLWGPEYLSAAVRRTPPSVSCFASVYSFTRIRESSRGGCVDYSSARVSTIFLDFDGPRSWEDARRFKAWASARGMTLRWFFSGSKGWHGYLDFPEWPGDPGVIRPAVSLLRDLSGCASIDLRSADGPARVARVDGTLHPATGLRCVAADPDWEEVEVFRAALGNGNMNHRHDGDLSRLNALPAYALLSLPPCPPVEAPLSPSNLAALRFSAVPGTVEAGQQKGARTLGALAVACHARISGQNEGMARARVARYASRCSPPLDAARQNVQVRSAYHAAAPGALMRWALAEMARRAP